MEYLLDEFICANYCDS